MFFWLIDFFLLICLGVIFLFVLGDIFLFFSGLHQRSDNYGLLDKSGLPPIFVNEVLLEHRDTHVSSLSVTALALTGAAE